jgi:hypothetical protein
MEGGVGLEGAGYRPTLWDSFWSRVSAQMELSSGVSIFFILEEPALPAHRDVLATSIGPLKALKFSILRFAARQISLV